MSENATQAAETVTLTIDGAEVTVPKGTTILQATKQAGITVPHYCFHEGLSRPAMCRLCLVEVEGAPKLQPSCNTPCGDGQVVRTQSEKALQMRRGVLEFYLVNHPLDCPICDQSGECFLQDYTHMEGRPHGRSREPKRVLGRDDFGGDVLFNGDRCVMCTRCVRFMNEIEQDPVLTVVERGNRSVIDTFFEEGLDDTKWSGNIVDICPVGALVSKDFLHKQRSWDLDHTPSICTSCSQGCNIDLHTRDNLVQRLKPRANMDVNAFWMCDHGRANYEFMNRGDRNEVPLVKDMEGRVAAHGWREALHALAEAFRGTGDTGFRAVVSPNASNEDIAAVKALGALYGNAEIVYRSVRTETEDVLKGMPSLARRKELAANGRGAELLGARRVGNDDGTGGLDDVAKHTGLLVVVGDELADVADDFGAAADTFVYVGAHPSKVQGNAHFVLPATTHAECEGTFTNVNGRVQRFWQGLHGPGAARPAWQVLGALVAELSMLGEMDHAPVVGSAAEAFASMVTRTDAFAGLDYESLGTRGAVVNETVQLAGD